MNTCAAGRSLQFRVTIVVVAFAGPILLLITAFLPFTAAFALPGTDPGEPIRGWQMVCLLQLWGHLFLLFDHPWFLVQVPGLIIGATVVAATPVFLRGPPVFNFACSVCLLVSVLAPISLTDYFVAPRLIGFYAYVATLIVAAVGHVLIGFAKSDVD